jgi:hypothetical protein
VILESDIEWTCQLHRGDIPSIVGSVIANRTVAVGVAVLLAASLVLLACGGRRDATIVDAVLEGERTLVLGIDACNADENRVSTIEDPETVRVSVTTDDAPGGDDCADGVRVELAAPLGGRELIDETTGEPVEVRQTP